MCVTEKTHGKVLVCRGPREKRTSNYFFPGGIFRRVPWKNRTAMQLFAMRPKNAHDKGSSARQRAVFP
jgi:hypothetical protein